MSSVLDKGEFVHVSTTIMNQIIQDTAEPMEDDCGTRMSQYMNGVYGNNESYVSNLIYFPSDFPPAVPQQEETIEIGTASAVIFDEQMTRDWSLS